MAAARPNSNSAIELYDGVSVRFFLSSFAFDRAKVAVGVMAGAKPKSKSPMDLCGDISTRSLLSSLGFGPTAVVLDSALMDPIRPGAFVLRRTLELLEGSAVGAESNMRLNSSSDE